MAKFEGPGRDLDGYGSNPPGYPWPGGARVAVSFVMNWEEGSELSYWMGDGQNTVGMSETPGHTPAHIRDLGIESVYEYGSRAGIWRLQRLFDRYDIPLTFFTTAWTINRYPDVNAWIRERNHEPAGHGLRWDRVWEFDRDEELHRLKESIRIIESHLGVRPLGWYSRYSASVHTRDLLVQEGFVYDSDSYADDVPYFTQVGEKRHLVVPYSLTTNDGRFTTSPGYTDPQAFLDHLIRTYDYLWEEGDEQPKMMSIGLHPRIAGQPARAHAIAEFIDHVGTKGGGWFAKRIDIANWWLEQDAKAKEGQS